MYIFRLPDNSKHNHLVHPATYYVRDAKKKMELKVKANEYASCREIYDNVVTEVKDSLGNDLY